VPAVLAVLAVVFFVREKAAPIKKKVEINFRAAYDRRFWFLLVVILVFTLGNSSDMFLLLRAGQLLGYPLDFGPQEHEAMARQWNFPWQLPAMFFILSMAKMLFTLPGGFIADRIGRAKTLALGWAVYAAVYLAFAFATEAWHVWVLFVAYGLFYGFTEGVQKAVIADFVRPEVRGAAYGMAYFCEGIAKLVASPLFGLLYFLFAAPEHPESGAHVAFGFGAACAAVACVLLVILLGVFRRREV
jgi:MFS family permease